MKQKDGGTTRGARAARLKRIVSAVRTNSTIRLNALAEDFGVSTETIRRDLDRLASEGLVNRTFGGASAFCIDPSLSQRLEANAAARDLIAQAAVGMVATGNVLFISSGVTSLTFAQHLTGSGGALTVITPSLLVAAALGRNPQIRVILAPGDYDPGEQAVFGPETQAFLRRFRADALFYGASGLTADGPTETRSAVAWNLRAMIGRAERRVLMIDQAKFGLSHLEQIGPLGELNAIVTDAPPTGALAEAISAAGANLHIAAAAG